MILRGLGFALSATLCAAVALLAAAPVDAAGTGAIEGEVVGPGGTPVAEVWACAYLAQIEEFEENCDLADVGGAYSISGLEAGGYKVEFWSESVEPSYVGEFYDDKPFWEEADEVEVEEGVATTGIDAELAEGATIKGEIRAASLGGPVESAAVCGVILPMNRPEGCALVRPDGFYTLPGLPPGKYQIEFLPSNEYNLLVQFYDHKSLSAEADLLDVTAGETKTGIDADLEPGAEISGTVYSAATSAPVPEVLVCLLAAEPLEEGPLRECRETTGTGSYAFKGLYTDSYKVAFSPEYELFGGLFFGPEADGYLTQYFDNKPTFAAADPIAMVVPQVRTGIDAHIQPEHSVSPPPTPALSPAIATPLPRRGVAKRCRPGFRKRRVAGKRRCVRVHKHKKHKHRRGGHRNGRARS